MRSKKNKVKRPSLFWLMTEAGRASAELAVAYPYHLLFDNKFVGDGHPVLVLPGFMATDVSTIYLRRFVQKAGYTAIPWELGRNYGSPMLLNQLSIQVENLCQQYGQKVSIIGWSLGGIFARQLGKMHPQKVRQIITLGAPFQGIGEANNAAWLFNLLSGNKTKQHITPELIEDLPNPAPVPTTAVYSKQDGIVPWQLCMEIEESSIRQNIEVRGSHFGLIHNPSVLRVVADRLQYTTENWELFTANSFFEDFLLFPSL